jgi:SAM-dependent methyltransferase
MCQSEFAVREGLYRFLLPEREAALQPFLHQYRLVREREGYRSPAPDYYRALPDVPARDPQAPVWRVRRESFTHLTHRILPRFPHRPLRVLDLGAGNGWLSYRLAELGYHCLAVDWLDDEADGLGARRHYPLSFIGLQADFDQLPFHPRGFELVIFNASVHYSPDVRATLERAIHLLEPGGALVVMDSPLYLTEKSGQQMLAEQAGRLKAQSGLSEIIQPGEGYMTFSDLDWLATRLTGCEFFPTHGGMVWNAKRYLAALKLRREPAAFGVAVGFQPKP